jgi:hypothetical protein
MPRLTCALALSLFTLFCRSQTCVPPAGETGEPYLTLSGASKRELDLVLREYMFLHRWTRH